MNNTNPANNNNMESSMEGGWDFIDGENNGDDNNNANNTDKKMDSTTEHDDNDDDDDEKSHTFRKRRLSLPNLSRLDDKSGVTMTMNHDKGIQEEEGGGGVEGGEEKCGSATIALQQQQEEKHRQQQKEDLDKDDEDRAHSFRKRRLSLTQNRVDAGTDDVDGGTGRISNKDDDNNNINASPIHINKRRRRNSDTSASTLDSNGNSINGTSNSPPKYLKSRTLHAAELLSHPPPSPSHRSALPKLYQQAAPPQNLPFHNDGGTWLDGNYISNTSTTTGPKWKKRHTRNASDHERNLPFPLDVVGTFSCHGVEPIYDSDYQFEDDDDDEEEEEEDDGNDDSDNDDVIWGANGPPPGGKHVGLNKAVVTLEKPTMAAKINQDRGGVACPYGNCAKTAIFAVYDGHGQGGELVSQYALHEVQRLLEKHPDFITDIGKAFRETFIRVDTSLSDECLIEPLYAGTTACVALLRDNRLTLSNAGDSRAVLARKKVVVVKTGGVTVDNSNDDIKWEATNLTIDQNPDLPEEQARIERMGGFVSPPPEPGLSARVWLDAQCSQIGLAMARSIGDHAVKTVGVIAEPVISYHDIQPDDDFVIIATDGVWEFLSSQEAVDIVSKQLHKGATKACRSLIEAAAARWHDEEGDYRDDITALVIRLQHLWKRSNDHDDGHIAVRNENA